MFGSKFKGPPSDPSAGVVKLQSIITEKLSELSSLIHLIKQRSKLEDSYATGLLNINFDHAPTIDNRMPSYLSYKLELDSVAENRLQTVKTMLQLNRQLEAYIEDCKRMLNPKVDYIRKGWDKYFKMLKEVQRLESQARLKFKMLKDSSNSDETDDGLMLEIDPIQISSDLTFNVEDFNELIGQMQAQIENEEVWHIFGNFKECYKGSDLLQFLNTNEWSEKDSVKFLEYLIRLNFLKQVKLDGNGFDNNAHYQWKRTVLDTPTGTRHSIKSEANRAAAKVEKATRLMEKLKLDVEMAMNTFFEFAESALTEHITMIRETLLQMLTFDESNIQAVQKSIENVKVYLETIDSKRELKSITEKHKTGIFPVPTFVPETFGEHTRIFGIALESHCEHLNVKVPPFIRLAIQHLQKIYDKDNINKEELPDQLDLWMSEKIDLKLVNAFRTELNQNRAKKRLFDQWPPSTIVGALKLYLIELPVSLCPDEIYLPLKMVYLSKTDNDATDRLNSVRNILGITN